MLPYDFSKENFTHMGYVTEGVTTYMGDRILFESGVFSRNEYFNELEKLFQRHFHSDGRNHYSVSWNPAKLVFIDPSKDVGFSMSYSPWLRALVNDINLAYL
jgi:predicted metalloprotease with PDZ domain